MSSCAGAGSAATAAAQKWLTNQATGFIVDALTRKVDLEQPLAYKEAEKELRRRSGAK